MSTYEFPMRPVPAVGAIVFRGSQVLLVRRRDPPSQGRWSIPGGAVEVGETVEQAVVRETREETTVEVRPQAVVAVADFIEKEGERIRWHYVLLDLLCVDVRGEHFAGSDAEFADQKVRAGHWRPEEAQALSRHSVESFLPVPGPSEGHRVYRAVDELGRGVGWIWVGPPPVRMLNLPTRRWLYQITVEGPFRGKGYGRAMLEATEELV